jgi:hypothetical protein
LKLKLNLDCGRFKKEMAKYMAAKKRLEDKLAKRRHAREEEFRGLGESPAAMLIHICYV